MSRSLTLTPAQWAAVQAGGWLVMPGDPCTECDNGSVFLGDDDDIGDACGECVDGAVPPDVLVAAAAPCETCGGRRWHPATSPDEPGAACTHCRIALLGECPNCDGSGREDVIPGAVYERCAECQGAGTVTLGYAYAVCDVLPIVRHDVDVAGPCIVAWHREPFPEYVLFASADAEGVPVALGAERLALVGQYALRLEVVP